MQWGKWLFDCLVLMLGWELGWIAILAVVGPRGNWLIPSIGLAVIVGLASGYRFLHWYSQSVDNRIQERVESA